jgi:hypothetical protein
LVEVAEEADLVLVVAVLDQRVVPLLAILVVEAAMPEAVVHLVPVVVVAVLL